MLDEPREIVNATVMKVLPHAIQARHHLHRHPELSFHEEHTARFIAEKLGDIGVDSLQTSVGGNGIIATVIGKNGSGPILALRADMDALPIHEEGDVEYRSEYEGVMHACGHDGHSAVLLGTAEALCSLRTRFAGTVRLIFQPAEEVAAGARAIVEEGGMKDVDGIFALHGWPGMDVGRIGIRTGAMMASADTFDITIEGRGAHAAMPHLSVDPIVAGAHVVTALQSIVSRETSPVDSVVVSVTQFHAGSAHNIIPARAELKGTVRCLTSELRQIMPERVERVVAGVCSALNAEYKINYRFGTPVTINDENMVTLVREVGSACLGEDNVEHLEWPSLGAEDFAVYLGHAPGAMFRLGTGLAKPPLHTPTYDFGDEPLRPGIEMMTQLALRYLAGASIAQ